MTIETGQNLKPTPDGTAQPTIGELVATATADLSTLLRKEVELAKLEVAGAAKKAGIGAGAFGGAGFMAFLGLIFLSIAAAEGIGTGLPRWLGFLIVGAVYLVLAVALGLLGKTFLGKVGAPKRTIATTKDTVAWAKHPTKTP